MKLLYYPFPVRFNRSKNDEASLNRKVANIYCFDPQGEFEGISFMLKVSANAEQTVLKPRPLHTVLVFPDQFWLKRANSAVYYFLPTEVARLFIHTQALMPDY